MFLALVKINPDICSKAQLVDKVQSCYLQSFLLKLFTSQESNDRNIPKEKDPGHNATRRRLQRSSTRCELVASLRVLQLPPSVLTSDPRAGLLRRGEATPPASLKPRARRRVPTEQLCLTLLISTRAPAHVPICHARARDPCAQCKLNLRLNIVQVRVF